MAMEKTSLTQHMKSYEGLYRQGHKIMKASLTVALLQKKQNGDES